MAKARQPGKIKKARVMGSKPFNAGTMTANGFWNMIRMALRRKTMHWKPVINARNSVRRPYKGPNKRLKYEYQCQRCGKWYPGTKVSVHHVVPAGTLTCADDLPGFVTRLFCEIEGLRVYCDPCHDAEHEQLIKTSQQY